MGGYKLRNRSVLVTGGSRGLGAAVAEKFAAEGSNVAINYANREQPAAELAARLKKEYGVKTIIIQGDCGIDKDCKYLVHETVKAFGGLDVVVSNAGWTKFANFADLNSLAEEDWDKLIEQCWAVNVKGNLFLLREAMPSFNSNAEGGVFIMTSSIAGQRIGGSSMPYSVTKAAQLHFMRCAAQTQGPKLRINAVLPGLLLTDWGQLYPKEAIARLTKEATLQKVTEIDQCAETFVWIAKNTSMTGQRISVDAGLNVSSL